MLSVLLPYRNAAATLREAMQSVLAEPEVGELVAVDDGSHDGSGDVARSMQDARIVHLRTTADTGAAAGAGAGASTGAGVAAALSLGLRCARGDVIARMDADDVSLPGRFDAELELLASDASLGVVGCLVEPLGDTGDGMRAYIAWQNGIVSARDHAREVFVESPLCHPSTAMRRTALEHVGGFRDAPWAEDYDLWLRMDAAGIGMAKVPRVLFRWRQGDAPGAPGEGNGRARQRVTFTDVRCSFERLRRARAHYLAPRLAAMGRPLCIWGAGPTGKRLARELEGAGRRTEVFVDIDPRKIGHTRRGAPVVGAEALPSRTHTIVVAVGARGARELVRAELHARGLREGHDFLCAS